MCDEAALIYVAYSPYGKSPRLLMLAGEKAAMLEQLHGGAGVLSMRCVEHACRLVEDMANGERSQ